MEPPIGETQVTERLELQDGYHYREGEEPAHWFSAHGLQEYLEGKPFPQTEKEALEKLAEIRQHFPETRWRVVRIREERTVIG